MSKNPSYQLTPLVFKFAPINGDPVGQIFQTKKPVWWQPNSRIRDFPTHTPEKNSKLALTYLETTFLCCKAGVSATWSNS